MNGAMMSRIKEEEVSALVTRVRPFRNVFRLMQFEGGRGSAVIGGEHVLCTPRRQYFSLLFWRSE